MLSVKQFVEDSLVQIAEGIQGAQERVRDMNVKFFPCVYKDGGKISEIEFDMAVTVEQSAEKGHEVSGSLAVIAAVFSLGGSASGSNKEANLTVSRIRFTVQAQLPAASKNETHPKGRVISY
ncbi:hypothetical protein FACS1894187_05280 [Synergistales bacterium]|nr:hypothetical protein FACS1894187_05280 [Synergistales bacterium]